MRKSLSYLSGKLKRRAVLGAPLNGTFIGGNGADWLASNLPALMSLNFVASTPTGVNAYAYGIGPASALVNDVGLGFPTGKTFVGTEAFFNVLTGATAGTYTVDMVVVDHLQNKTVLVTVTGAANTWLRGTAKNIVSGLYALAGPSAIRVGWFNRATSPGALANNAHAAHLSGVFL